MAMRSCSDYVAMNVLMLLFHTVMMGVTAIRLHCCHCASLEDCILQAKHNAVRSGSKHNTDRSEIEMITMLIKRKMQCIAWTACVCCSCCSAHCMSIFTKSFMHHLISHMHVSLAAVCMHAHTAAAAAAYV
jgi:hypothetical protein